MPRRALTVLVCSVGWVVAGCAGPVPAGGPAVESQATAEQSPDGSPTPGATTAAVPFDLYTHCGIHELRFDGRFFERVGGPLTDGSHNPPPGWGNPEQPGLLTVSEDSAVFTDDLGHREVFRLREGATDFLQLCM